MVSYGGGVNSTALLIGLHQHRIPVDLILFADTGAEHSHKIEGRFRIPQPLEHRADSIISKDKHSSTTNDFHIVAGILVCVCWNI